MNIGTRIKKGEYWYGGLVSDGYKSPFGFKIFKRINISHSRSNNQTASFLVSSKGRYIWCEEGMNVTVTLGYMTVESQGNAQIYFEDNLGTLKHAYLKAKDTFFKPTGKMPNENSFRYPQYCTWMACGVEQTERNILDYAESILKSGMPAGELIIDDGWQSDFGDWNFDMLKFDNPKKLIEVLKKLGFKVVMWIVPFVSKSSKSFQYLADNGLLVKDSTGAIAMRKWWRGSSALLDLSNPAAVEWFLDVCARLKENYGVEGFKLDGGDAKYYRDDDINYGKVSASRQSYYWAELAEVFDYNEVRASFNNCGQGFVSRISDRMPVWGKRMGLGSLIPNALAQGITGHPFACPDMIGGGVIQFAKNIKKYDREFLLRCAQCASLMPAMQFSAPIWDYSKELAEKLKLTLEQREKFIGYIIELVKSAAETGEPVMRYMEYGYPNQGLETVTDQFLLGDKYIVAPVLKKLQRKRDIYLPSGYLWKNLLNGQIYRGGQAIEVRAGLDDLPVMERIEN